MVSFPPKPPGHRTSIFCPLAGMADVGVAESGDATTDELDAAAAVLEETNESAASSMAAASDPTTTSATNTRIDDEGVCHDRPPPFRTALIG